MKREDVKKPSIACAHRSSYLIRLAQASKFVYQIIPSVLYGMISESLLLGLSDMVSSCVKAPNPSARDA